MSTPYINKCGKLKLKFYDATSTTNIKFEAVGISEFPSLQDPRIKPELVDYLEQGCNSGAYEGNDSIERPENTFTLDLLEEQMSDNAFKPETFLVKMKDPADGTTDLTSTNTGSVVVLDQNGADKTISLPQTIKTLGMAVLWIGPNGDTEKDLGIDYGVVKFTNATYNAGGAGEASNMQFTFVIHQRGTNITKSEYEAL